MQAGLLTPELAKLSRLSTETGFYVLFTESSTAAAIRINSPLAKAGALQRFDTRPTEIMTSRLSTSPVCSN